MTHDSLKMSDLIRFLYHEKSRIEINQSFNALLSSSTDHFIHGMYYFRRFWRVNFFSRLIGLLPSINLYTYYTYILYILFIAFVSLILKLPHLLLHISHFSDMVNA